MYYAAYMPDCGHFNILQGTKDDIEMVLSDTDVECLWPHCEVSGVIEASATVRSLRVIKDWIFNTAVDLSPMWLCGEVRG